MAQSRDKICTQPETVDEANRVYDEHKTQFSQEEKAREKTRLDTELSLAYLLTAKPERFSFDGLHFHELGLREHAKITAEQARNHQQVLASDLRAIKIAAAQQAFQWGSRQCDVSTLPRMMAILPPVDDSTALTNITVGVAVLAILIAYRKIAVVRMTVDTTVGLSRSIYGIFSHHLPDFTARAKTVASAATSAMHVLRSGRR